MEFTTAPQTAAPKNLYPCLATITVTPHGAEYRARRRSSGGSFDGTDGNALTRVLSGGRRRSVATDANKAPTPVVEQDDETGTWYWRVQAGVTDGHLVLLPLSQPPNPVLTTRPVPLSQAMPAHSAAARANRSDEGIAAKIKHLFTRGSSSHTTAQSQDQTSDPAGTNTSGVDPILDQTPDGQAVPSTEANAIGATNLNANAETSWPGIIQGQHLGAVVVDLRAVDKSKVVLGENKKEGSTVTVPVSASVIFSLLEPVGSHTARPHKSGQIRFEFDKDWLGAKGEAELLHHSIQNEIENAPSAHPAPRNEPFQLGGHGANANAPVVREVAPDQIA